MSDQQQTAMTPGGVFREGFVEADGFRIRYCEAGQGTPLVHLHGAGGLRLNAAHELLATSVPRHCGRDAGVRPVAGEHADPLDAGTGGDDRQGG